MGFSIILYLRTNLSTFDNLIRTTKLYQLFSLYYVFIIFFNTILSTFIQDIALERSNISSKLRLKIIVKIFDFSLHFLRGEILRESAVLIAHILRGIPYSNGIRATMYNILLVIHRE